MKDYGSKKPPIHNNKRLTLAVVPNFPPSPELGEVVYYKSDSVSGIFVYVGDSVWDKLQSISNTIIPMGSDFPGKLNPASLFYNNRADDEDGVEPPQYGFYYVSDSGVPVRLLDSDHSEDDDPHPEYIKALEVISNYQPLRVVNSLSAKTQCKLVPGELWASGLFPQPIALKAGFYKVSGVLFVHGELSIHNVVKFGHETTGVCVSHCYSADSVSQIEFNTHLSIERDTNVVPNIMLMQDAMSGTKHSSVTILKNSYIAYELIY
jgi:hypothetical protein